MKTNIKYLDVKIDERGWFVEVLRQENLTNKEFGQMSITVAYPGQTKGKHYHTRKTEWYCVIKGESELILTDNKTKKTKKINISGKKIGIVEIPPNVFHAIKNIGKEEMMLLVYCDESFNKKDQDTFYE